MTELLKINIPEGYKPTEDEEFMNPVMQEYFRQKLQALQVELLASLRVTRTGLRDSNSTYISDAIDRAAGEMLVSSEVMSSAQVNKRLKEVEFALLRIEEGEYGYCEQTGDPISIKRLEANLCARLSIGAQEELERKNSKMAPDKRQPA